MDYTHIKYQLLAQENLKAYQHLNQKNNFIEFFHVKYSVICRSLELLFKSWLFFKGFNPKDVRRKSHKLELALQAVLENSFEEDLSIQLTEEFKKTVSVLGEFYYSFNEKTKQTEKEFEYPNNGSKLIPTLDVVEMEISKLLKLMNIQYHKHYRFTKSQKLQTQTGE